MVERIRSLLARFSENEETVRQLVATDARFDALRLSGSRSGGLSWKKIC